MKPLLLFCFGLLPFFGTAQTIKQDQKVDSLAAINIAENAWNAKFGAGRTQQYRPFTAKLINDSTWFVRGHLEGSTGSILHAEIRRRDGKVLYAIGMK